MSKFKDPKEKMREFFRVTNKIRNINSVKKEPGYDYKWVISTYEHEGPERIERYIDNKWDVVYSSEAVQDDRKDTPNSNKEELRQAPVTRTSRGGHQMVLMRRKVEDSQASELAKAERDKKAFERSAGRRVKRRGNEEYVTEADININDNQ